MKTNTFLLFFLSLLCFQSIGQKSKIIYFDEDWLECKQKDAYYYRELTTENDLYLVKDYYYWGDIQMTGQYTDRKLTVETGEFIYYYETGDREEVWNYVAGVKSGEYLSYYEGGQKKVQATYNNDRYTGLYQEFFPDGQLRAEAVFTKEYYIRSKAVRYHPNGSKRLVMDLDSSGTGSVRGYYLNGELQIEGQYRNGYRIGRWNYYAGGKVVDTREYNEFQAHKDRIAYLRSVEKSKTDREPENENELIDQTSLVFFMGYEFGEEELEGIIKFPDEEAKFDGGHQALAQYISDNVAYPDKALKKNIEGRTYIKFVVETDGSVTNVEFEGGSKIFKNESIRVVKAMPNWIPGKVAGEPVRTRCRLPIIYQLED